MKDKIIIYGAMSVALGIGRAFAKLYPEKTMLGYVVSRRADNPEKLDGFWVRTIDEFAEKTEDKNAVTVVIGTPETEHPVIIETLKKYGFKDYFALDWINEEKYMTDYYRIENIFPSVHDLKSSVQNRVKVFVVRSREDAEIRNAIPDKKWFYSLQAGAFNGRIPALDYYDDEGDNISRKNRNYSELTALYWIWKHMPDDIDYCGMFQYRRLLNISDEDWDRIKENNVDVVLPLPTIHFPDIFEHHQRGIRDANWNAMMMALRELQPAYKESFQKLLKQEYFYNYNIIVAKPRVIKEYCAWLFPILERTEQLSESTDAQSSDRYIGYLGENLATLYFLHNKTKLYIYHAGRVMLT